jgi:hypothetical protein
MAWFGKKDPPPKPRPQQEAPTGDPVKAGKIEPPPISRALAASERAFLVTCCDMATHAVVTWPELGIVRRVTFSKVDDDQLHMAITNDAGVPYVCRPRTQCVVSYYYLDRIVCFTGYEESRGAGQRPELLVLRMPTQLAVEGRTRFRIPILPKLELTVTVHANGQAHRVPQPVDISVAGMMLAFPRERDPGLQADELISLELSLEGANHRVPCTIRNRIVRPEDVRYGVLFHNGSNGFDYDQDRELNDTIMGIERFWARNRNR